MIFSNYKYIDVAFGGPQNRNNLICVEELKNYADKWRKATKLQFIDCYTTYNRYPEEIVEHFKKTNSVSGYSGPCYADYLPIDVDSENLEKSLDSARGVLSQLNNKFDVDLKDVRVFFSGAKGFHIEIPSPLFDPEPCEHLPAIFKNMAKEYIPDGLTVDESIYEKVRLWRIKNTINSKTGLHKIPLSSDEIFVLTISEIEEMAKNPRKL